MSENAEKQQRVTAESDSGNKKNENANRLPVTFLCAPGSAGWLRIYGHNAACD
jgi:hypothetical protein